MSGIATRQRDFEAEYEAIEIAVKETQRGRWFLSEYAKRNRHADTEMLLSALSRIERSVVVQRTSPEFDKVRLDVLEMSKAIARTHVEIAAIKPDDAGGGPIFEASGELDSIVLATESATSDILAAAERVQEAAWTLREANVEPAICDLLDSRATEIYTACSFQDLTAQRTRKVIETLDFLERRLAAMVDIWQFSEPSDEKPKSRDPAAEVPGRDAGMSQADVDHVLIEPAARSGPAAPPSPAREAAAAESIDEILFSEPAPAPPTEPARLQLVRPEPQATPGIAASGTAEAQTDEPATIDDTLRKVRSGAELSPDEAARALDMLQALSVEERTRLFS